MWTIHGFSCNFSGEIFQTLTERPMSKISGALPVESGNETTVPGTVWGTPRETDIFFHLLFEKFNIENIKFTYISSLNSLIFQANNYFWISSKLLSNIVLDYIAYNQRSLYVIKSIGISNTIFVEIFYFSYQKSPIETEKLQEVPSWVYLTFL